MDVRDAMKAGKTTVIIPTGGIEPNGPWLATGKHNYVLHANCEAIARKLGNALCAPIIKLVPEGDIEPQTGHMTSPGTISDARGDVPRRCCTDIARQPQGARLQEHHPDRRQRRQPGGPEGGRREADDEVGRARRVVAHIPEYYDYAGVAKYMEQHGIKDGAADNMHDDPIITLNMFITDPNSVRYNERVKAGKATINGVNIADKSEGTQSSRSRSSSSAPRPPWPRSTG